MFLVAREFNFDASHELPWLRDSFPDHYCMAGRHGHRWRVEFVLASYTLNERGEVADLRSLDYVGDFLQASFNHKHLNDVLASDKLVTAEGLAGFLWERFEADYDPDLVMVRVRHSGADIWAEYHPDSPSSLRADGALWPLPHGRAQRLKAVT